MLRNGVGTGGTIALSASCFCWSASRKVCSFPDKNSMPKTTQSIDAKIIRSIRAKRSASVFSAKDFAQYGGRAAVWQALTRLAKAGKVRRIRQGLYDFPRAHPLLGQTAPDAMAVVRRLMEGSNAQWQVSGAYAANLLGLSEQVPAKIVILTDGVPRRVPLGKLTLVFRRAAPRNLLGTGRPAGLVVQAIRHLRAAGMTPVMIARLRRRLDRDTKEDLAALTPDLPAWMQAIVRQIAGTE